jgi:elongation factor G
MFGYATDVRSLSKGRADYSMQPLRFDPVPQHVTDKILDRF